jgi:hypothetical protein
MRVLLDTNVVLDVLLNRVPFAEPAAELFSLCDLPIHAVSRSGFSLRARAKAARAIAANAANERRRQPGQRPVIAGEQPQHL